MIEILNEEFLNLKDNKASLNFDLREQSDSLSMNLKLNNMPAGEYAVIFITKNREYTSAIFQVESINRVEKRIQIEKNKVKEFDRIEIVDIYSGDILFGYDYEDAVEEEMEVPTLIKDKNILKEDIEIIKEEEFEDNNIENDIPLIKNNEAEEMAFDVDELFDEETNKKENEDKLKKKDDLKVLENLFDIFSPKNKNSTENDFDDFESALDEELKNYNDNNLSDKSEYEFIEKKEEKTVEKPKKIINANDVLIEDIMEEFSVENFLSLDGEHKFYYVDENDSRLDDINIIYNGFVMPLIYPFMGYKNLELENAVLPNWIFGKLVSENELKYYVYGILGSNKDDTQPFLGSTGFIYYEPSAYDGYGYWLMYISVKTGKICLL